MQERACYSRLARLVPRVAGGKYCKLSEEIINKIVPDPTRLPRDVVLHRAADMIQARQTRVEAKHEVTESKPKIEELLLAPWITNMQESDY